MFAMSTNDDDVAREAVIRAELNALTEETVQMNLYRDYYDGDQKLVYSTKIFDEVFGDAFKGFKDNWVRVIVNSVNNRLELLSFDIEDDKEFVTANRIWAALRTNEINTQQRDLHEGVLVEGRAFIIVWPDGDGGVTIDWQPGQICRVFYDPDRRTKALWAVRRWVVEGGDTFITFYTPTLVFKFTVEGLKDVADKPSSSSALTEIPGIGFFSGLTRRVIEGEEWPLPNPFNKVPVVEFNNSSYRSEIKDAIPQQDALNKVLIDMMLAGEFQAFPQRVVETTSAEPVGGWTSGPGEVWQFKPSFDSDGKHIPAQFKTFEAADPSTYMEPISMWLQHMAFTSSTPARFFVKSDQGGRGDAPSGDSLLVDDKPLNDKVDAKHKELGNRWMEVARLIASALGIKNADKLIGDAVWRDPRHDQRLSRLKEGLAMIEIGISIEFVVLQIGFSPSEIAVLLKMIKEEKQKELEAEEKEMEMRGQGSSTSNSTSNNSSETSDAPSTD